MHNTEVHGVTEVSPRLFAVHPLVDVGHYWVLSLCHKTVLTRRAYYVIMIVISLTGAGSGPARKSQCIYPAFMARSVCVEKKTLLVVSGWLSGATWD